jgi:hypothetical protein
MNATLIIRVLCKAYFRLRWLISRDTVVVEDRSIRGIMIISYDECFALQRNNFQFPKFYHWLEKGEIYD